MVLVFFCRCRSQRIQAALIVPKAGNRTTWDDASSFCQQRGGNLPTISSSNMTNAVLAALPSGADVRLLYIGANDKMRENGFVWAFGYGWRYTNWNSISPLDLNRMWSFATWVSFEPNDLHGGEDCVEMSAANGWKWNDIPCGSADRLSGDDYVVCEDLVGEE